MGIKSMTDNWSTAWSTPAPETLEQQLDKLSRDEVLIRWEQAKDKLAAYKEEEMTIRKFVVKKAFPTPVEGTNTLELASNYELKATVKFNYNLNPDIEEVEKALDEIASMGNEGAYIADRLVKWEAIFLLIEYRKLCDKDATDIHKKIKKIIDRVLTITDAAPSVKITENKKKKM